MRLKSSPLRGPFILMSWDRWIHSHFIFSILSEQWFANPAFLRHPGLWEALGCSQAYKAPRGLGMLCWRIIQKRALFSFPSEFFPFGLLLPCHPLCFCMFIQLSLSSATFPTCFHHLYSLSSIKTMTLCTVCFLQHLHLGNIETSVQGMCEEGTHGDLY